MARHAIARKSSPRRVGSPYAVAVSRLNPPAGIGIIGCGRAAEDLHLPAIARTERRRRWPPTTSTGAPASPVARNSSARRRGRPGMGCPNQFAAASSQSSMRLWRLHLPPAAGTPGSGRIRDDLGFHVDLARRLAAGARHVPPGTALRGAALAPVWQARERRRLGRGSDGGWNAAHRPAGLAPQHRACVTAAAAELVGRCRRAELVEQSDDLAVLDLGEGLVPEPDRDEPALLVRADDLVRLGAQRLRALH